MSNLAPELLLEAQDWRDLLQQADQACRAALTEPALEGVASRVGLNRAECARELSSITAAPDTAHRVQECCAQSSPSDPLAFGRWILLSAASHAIGKVGALRVTEEVKALWASEILQLAQPTPLFLAACEPNNVRFREIARIVTLRRFPAGQFHWEISGIPRSFLLQTSFADLPGMFRFVLQHVRRLHPFAETHINALRKNRLTLTEAEGVRSYYLLARSMELQPKLNGLFTASWMYCKSAGVVTPRLAWMRNFLVENGACVASMGAAPEDSGFLIGSAERRALYEAGTYKPLMTYAIWPRAEMLRWAERHKKQMKAEQL